MIKLTLRILLIGVVALILFSAHNNTAEACPSGCYSPCAKDRTCSLESGSFGSCVRANFSCKVYGVWQSCTGGCEGSCPSGWSTNMPTATFVGTRVAECTCCGNNTTCYKGCNTMPYTNISSQDKGSCIGTGTRLPGCHYIRHNYNNCTIECYYNWECCQPKTCADLGHSCGSHPNGCGGTVNCGSCPSASCPNSTTRRTWSCSGGSCVSSDTSCPSAVCNGNNRRTWSCSGGSCSENTPINCGSNTSPSCSTVSTEECREVYWAQGCSGGSCYSNRTVILNNSCTNLCGSSGWYNVSGSTQWVSDGTECREKQQQRQEYRNYYCNGSCTYNIDTTKGVSGYRWVDIAGAQQDSNSRCASLHGSKCLNDGNRSFCVSGTCQSRPDPRPLSQIHNTNDYCNKNRPPIELKWGYCSQTNTIQTHYHLKVCRNEALNIGCDYDRKQACVDPCTNSIPSSIMTLNFNTTYYWGVKVWDINNNESNWKMGNSFTTLARHPNVSFTWSPSRPHLGEETTFADSTNFHGYSSNTSWLWTFEGANQDTSNLQNPTISFQSDGDKTIKLEVTGRNLSGQPVTCERIEDINVRPPLPEWKETASLDIIRRIFSTIFNWRARKIGLAF